MKHFQQHISTALFRNMLRTKLAGRAVGKSDSELSILSFGCSSGDELMTLKALFPKAKIQGCDINPVALAAARDISHEVEVFVSDWPAIMERGPYDMVFAMASLCRYPLPEEVSIQELFPFSQFEDTITRLCEQISPDGVLVLDNTNYPFRMTEVASKFVPVRSPMIQRNGYCDVFSGECEHLLKSGVTSFGNYYEVMNAEPLCDNDLRDCVFRKGCGADVELESPDLEGFREIGGWQRTNLQNLAESKKPSCIEIVSNFRMLRNDRSGDVVCEKNVRHEKLDKSGFIELGPVFHFPGIGQVQH